MPFRQAIRVAARLAVLGVVVFFVSVAEAQRPFSTLDPFYQEETARRAFFDGFALQADVAYLGTEPTVAAGSRVAPVALSLRFDYALARQLDVAAVVDASGGFDGSVGASPVRLSWLIAKPFWRHGNTDYAVRLAVDPAGDSGFGFRQTDLAFLSTSDLTPSLSTDFAIGLRRANVGFERIALGADAILIADPDPGARPEIVRSRATGTEMHIMWGYRFWLDPAGSHIFTTVSGEGMAYTMISSRATQEAASRPGDEIAPAEEGRLIGGVGRLNVGAEYSRPSFLISPYVSLPMFRWVDLETASRSWGPRIDHARFGLRVTVR